MAEVELMATVLARLGKWLGPGVVSARGCDVARVAGSARGRFP